MFASFGGIPRGTVVGPPEQRCWRGRWLVEAGVPFISASGSDFVEMYAGVGASRVRKLFKERGATRPASSSSMSSMPLAAACGNSISHEEREQTLNQLLVETTGFSRVGSRSAATNGRYFDNALLLSGRFGPAEYVGNPDLKGREQVLHLHSRKNFALGGGARGTPGFSGADLANLVNEAVLIAGTCRLPNRRQCRLRRRLRQGPDGGRAQVGGNEREGARGVRRPLRRGRPWWRRCCRKRHPLHKVTIMPRALGGTMQLPEADQYTHSKPFIESRSRSSWA